MEKTCVNCDHRKPARDSDPKQFHGDCHANPPQVIVASFKPGIRSMEGHKVGKIMTVWPRVMDSDTCGKWIPNNVSGDTDETSGAWS